MSRKANNIIRIPTTLDRKFFRYWLEFLKPFHKLARREMDIMTSFLALRYRLSKVILDDALLDQIVMNEDSKGFVRDECNVSVQHFQVIISKLRKNKLIVDDKINKRFIPNVTEEDGSFKLMIYFELKPEEDSKASS